jgi:hypothetical protein
LVNIGNCHDFGFNHFKPGFFHKIKKIQTPGSSTHNSNIHFLAPGKFRFIQGRCRARFSIIFKIIHNRFTRNFKPMHCGAAFFPVAV